MIDFLGIVWISLFVYTPLAIGIGSLLAFILRGKKYFFTYIVIQLNLILFVCSFFIFVINHDFGADSRYGYSIEFYFISKSALLFLLAVTVRLIINYVRSEKNESLAYYIKKNFYLIFYSFVKTLLFVFVIIQIFLLFSSVRAYMLAKESNYIDDNQSIWSFYSPTVKAINFHGQRYSYHRGKYVWLNE